MGDMLATGVSGLLAFQTSLDTISNNISNANTPGYSREVTNLAANPGQASSIGWIGNGVSVSSVSREYDKFLAAQARTASSSYNQLNTFSTLADSINNMLGDPSTGLPASLQSFVDSVQTLASSPDSTATRQAVLNQLQSLITQFQSYQSNLNQLGAQINTQLGAEASTISSLAQNIASLNQQIMAAKAQSQQPPNQLLDQRDQLISQLSKHIGLNTVTQSDGSVSVFIGSGQPLVVGTTAATLGTAPDAFGGGQLGLTLSVGAGGAASDVTGSLTGGILGGLLQFRDQMLTPVRNALGQAAVTLSSLVNTQNQAGLDLNGAIGQALLGVGAPQVLPNSANLGGETVTASVSALSALTTSNYVLKYDGTGWTLADSVSGTTVPVTVSTSGSTTTLTGAGLTVTVSGTAQAGDQFLIQPTAAAVSGLKLLTTDPAKIAAAGPLVTSAATTNTGSASIQSAVVPDLTAWTRGNYTLSFSGPASYTIQDATGATVASGSYSSGTPISFNGIDVTLTGTPAAGDSFAINDNANGTGDNSNALKLAGILSQKVLGGGTQSLSDAVASFVGGVGLQTSQAQNGASAQQAVLNSAQKSQQSVSGVNLDQEAASMLQYEQAYQAAAQVIKAANTVFQSLLTAVA